MSLTDKIISTATARCTPTDPHEEIARVFTAMDKATRAMTAGTFGVRLVRQGSRYYDVYFDGSPSGSPEHKKLKEKRAADREKFIDDQVEHAVKTIEEGHPGQSEVDAAVRKSMEINSKPLPRDKELRASLRKQIEAAYCGGHEEEDLPLRDAPILLLLVKANEWPVTAFSVNVETVNTFRFEHVFYDAEDLETRMVSLFKPGALIHHLLHPTRAPFTLV